MPGVLGATVGAPRSRANGLQVIDFAHRLVPPDQIKAAGFDGALVYVSELRPGATFDFKPVTRDYADGLRAAGLQVASCYQFGKPGWTQSPSDFTRGYDGGVADAQTALRLHAAAGDRRQRRSTSVSTRTSMPQRGRTWRPNGFTGSTPYWALIAPESTAAPANAPGRSTTG